jgi:hypothetical protein
MKALTLKIGDKSSMNKILIQVLYRKVKLLVLIVISKFNISAFLVETNTLFIEQLNQNVWILRYL